MLGGLVGAGVGYVAEQRLRSGEGIEYVVEMADGRTVTLVQNREPEEQPIPDGTPVLVQISSRYSRVLPHPRAEGGAASDWVDPDTVDSDVPVRSGTAAGAEPTSPTAERARQLLEQQ